MLFFPLEFHLVTQMWKILHIKPPTGIWETKSQYFFMFLSQVAFYRGTGTDSSCICCYRCHNDLYCLSIIWMGRGKKKKKKNLFPELSSNTAHLQTKLFEPLMNLFGFIYSNGVLWLSLPVFSWVNNFGHEGLGLLLDVLERLLDKKQ